ncbi:hypothetical protein D9756_002093 [Leucocoprinus leucothites]|uniref:Uncharacterized protein n=1 Tax=Leucocoprinus leucothites TaxID=201217 RepID=A0A8H5GBS6_9AGAR|nr:hypothetical protein D9756_002093 [Leucoagaricus leucothites]
MQFTIYTALFFSFLTSSLAYMVKVPNDKQGWYSHYVGRITWDRVDTDTDHFAIILTNQDRSVLPEDIVLKSWVSGGTPNQNHNIDIEPIKGGFPIGSHFRVNFVKIANEQQTIYAQSSEFTIKE